MLHRVGPRRPAQALAPGRVAGQPHQRGPQGRGVLLRHQQAVLPVVHHLGDARHAAGHHRPARGQRLEQRVGQAVHVAGAVDHGRDGHHVGGRQRARHEAALEVARQADRGPRGPGLPQQLLAQVALAGDHDVHVAQPGRGLDQVREALLLDQAPQGQHQRGALRHAQPGAHARHVEVGTEGLHVDAVGDGAGAGRVGPQRHRALAQVAAAGGHEAGPPEGPARQPAGGREALGQEDVAAVQAHHQRHLQAARDVVDHGGVRDHPVHVQRVVAGLAQALGQAAAQAGGHQRRQRVDQPLDLDVGGQALGVAPQRQAVVGGVGVREEPQAGLVRPPQVGVPGQHHVHAVAARHHAPRHLLDEGRGRVARELRVGRRDHQDAH